MFKMYLDEHTPEDDISSYFYFRVFRKLNLKFTRPDICGICDGFRNGTEEEKAALRTKYEKRILEKVTVRQIKKYVQGENNKKMLVDSFDLQQVIFLPRSTRCAVFFKRRLSCNNFSIYNIKSKEAHFFLWNESIVSRGANEIAAHLKGHFIEFKYYADGIYSGLTPPG